LVLAQAGADMIFSKEDLAAFSYIEHPENIALALAVCRHLGLDQTKSLAAMQRVRPDPGALQIWHPTLGHTAIAFVNGFSANDPVSTAGIWDLANEKFPQALSRVVVMNCRADRAQRSLDLAECLATWQGVDACLIVGEGGNIFEKKLRGLRCPVPRINLCGKPLPFILQQIESQSHSEGMVVGIGNIAGVGMDLVKWMAP